MKRSEAEKLLPHPWWEAGGWNRLWIVYLLEDHHLATQVIYYHFTRRNNQDGGTDLPEDVVMETPKLYDPFAPGPDSEATVTPSKP